MFSVPAVSTSSGTCACSSLLRTLLNILFETYCNFSDNYFATFLSNTRFGIKMLSVLTFSATRYISPPPLTWSTTVTMPPVDTWHQWCCSSVVSVLPAPGSSMYVAVSPAHGDSFSVWRPTRVCSWPNLVCPLYCRPHFGDRKSWFISTHVRWWHASLWFVSANCCRHLQVCRSSVVNK